MTDMEKAIDLAKKIEARAAALVSDMAREISTRCAGQPEFEAILWHAIERKVTGAVVEAECRAAAIKGSKS